MDIIKPSLLFLLGFGVITIFIPGIIGASITTGWLFLLILVPIVLCFYSVKLDWWLSLFVAYAAVSLLWTENFNIAWFYFVKLLVLALVFYIGMALKSDDFALVLLGLGFGLLISATLGLYQYLFDFDFVFVNEGTLKVAGLFVNKNIFCEISVILFVTFLVFELYSWIPVTLPGILIVHSRAALLSLGVVLFIWCCKHLGRGITILVTLTLISIVAVVFRNTQITSIVERYDLWVDSVKGLTFFGNGIGSYETLYPKNASLIDTALFRPRYAHNDLLQFVFELGIGTTFFLMMVWNVFKTKSGISTLPLVSIIIISMFSYPLYVPASAFLFFILSGYIIGNHAPDGGNGDFSRSDVPKRVSNRKV